MSEKILLQNIKTLWQVRENGSKPILGLDMKNCPHIQNAYLEIEHGKFSGYGAMDDFEGDLDSYDEILDLKNRMVFPTFVDSHTHLTFASTREGEFEDRINGLTYHEIAEKGGGILNSAYKTQQSTEDELYQDASYRLERLIQMGTGAIEIKSGYGLSVDAELKLLRVIKRLKKEFPIPIKATFLGAHAIPKEYKENREGYIDLIIQEMLPKIAAENLADYIDVFCETNYFTAEETNRILKAGAEHGLKAKIHVNQFTSIGGIETAVNNNAISVDHLEELSDKEIEFLAKYPDTIPTLLPSCSFFLQIPYGPARKMMNNNLPLALATDYNPGSTPSGNMQFIWSLACIQMKMTPQEALNAINVNSAAAMEVLDEVGSITIGKRASFIVSDETPSLTYIPYSFGENNIHMVFINGIVWHQKKHGTL